MARLGTRCLRFGTDRRRWRVVQHTPSQRPGYDGICFTEKREISLAKNLRSPDLLDTVIHEGLHAALPCLDEQTVEQVATQISSLWYHIVDNLPPLEIPLDKED